MGFCPKTGLDNKRKKTMENKIQDEIQSKLAEGLLKFLTDLEGEKEKLRDARSAIDKASDDAYRQARAEFRLNRRKSMVEFAVVLTPLVTEIFSMISRPSPPFASVGIGVVPTFKAEDDKSF